MKLLDLFSGIGGFSLAFKRVFPEGEIIGFSEIDKYAIQIYQKHFPGVKNYGSVTDIRAEDLPKFNIVTFGFPCQDLSIAGKRKGFTGQRSSLFHEAVRIINKCRPEYFVFENVAGLFSSHQGKDFITVLQAITDIGYAGQWQLVNTKWFLPQNRERIYFVGHLGGQSRPEIFPIGEINSEPTKRQGESPCIRTFCTGTNGGLNSHNTLIQVNHPKHSNDRVYDPEGISPTLNTMQGGNRQPFIVAQRGGESGQQLEPRFDGTSNTLTSVQKDNYVAVSNPSSIKIIGNIVPSGHECGNVHDITGIAPTVRENHGKITQIFNNSTIRRLTPIECERLQGFPDGWTEGISDSQRYKCLGNAITVNIPEEIFRRLKRNDKK